jgi:hypothetical protein
MLLLTIKQSHARPQRRIENQLQKWRRGRGAEDVQSRLFDEVADAQGIEGGPRNVVEEDVTMMMMMVTAGVADEIVREMSRWIGIGLAIAADRDRVDCPCFWAVRKNKMVFDSDTTVLHILKNELGLCNQNVATNHPKIETFKKRNLLTVITERRQHMTQCGPILRRPDKYTRHFANMPPAFRFSTPVKPFLLRPSISLSAALPVP